ncbi:MAG: YeeE/YedE family protein, partial [Nitrospirae bacterium]|nr:YeeE/YedE family protein [Nitrospirota bacterium]
GMLTGAALFAEAYPMLKKTVLTWGNYGKITLPQVMSINHWFIIPVFVIGGLVLFRWFEKKRL